MIAILIGVKLYLTGVLIYIPLMANDVERNFHVLTGHLYIFFGEKKQLFKSIFSIVFCGFLLLSCNSIYSGYKSLLHW